MATDIETELHDLKNDPAMLRHFEEPDEHGYTILEDALTGRQVDEAIREIVITCREERAADVHETGKIKRVVSSLLLLRIDAVPVTSSW